MQEAELGLKAEMVTQKTNKIFPRRESEYVAHNKTCHQAIKPSMTGGRRKRGVNGAGDHI